jgi:putative ABC transport system permease protein
MNAAAPRFALRRLAQGLRAGELRVIVFAVVVAAAAAVAVGLFTDRVRRAIEAGTADTLGADAMIGSHDAPSPQLLTRLRASGLRTTVVTDFPSVILFGDQTQLATIKAIADGYPLRGRLLLSHELFGPAAAATGAPPRGEVWVDPRLWTALGLSLGATLEIGVGRFTVSALIADEPGRGGSFGDFAPELLMNADDLAATQLLGPGSRVSYAIQLAGPSQAVERARAIALPGGARFTDPRNARPDIKRALERARRFLNLAVLATLLLSASAIALSARQHARNLRDEIALLKCIGARHVFLCRALIWQIGLLGASASALGALLGFAIQAFAASVAGPALHVTLPAPSLLPLLPALLLVLLLLAGFALPAMLGAIGTPPVRVFQRAADLPPRVVPSVIVAAATVGAMLWLQAGEVTLAAYVLAGAALTALALAGCAWLLLRALTPLRARAGVAWRFGLGNLVRRRGAAIAQIVALGVAMLALLLVTVVRQDLLASWQDRLPPRTPNQFLINIQPDQVDPLRAFFKRRGYADLTLWPMERARLVAFNGEPVAPDTFSDPETRRWVNREFNLSWTERFGDDNQLLQGRWWGADARGQPLLSADEFAFEHLKLKLGDTLTFDIAGQRFALKVYNERKVKWDSFRPNFFLVAPPGTLENAGAVQWITSFYLPAGDRALLRDLIRAFPNVTVIDLEAALAQVRGIMDRIVHALEFILLFALLAGFVVMLAVIEGSRADRVRETGVLRALGASSRVIAQGLIAEYAVLGLLAGAVASFGAQALAWTLAVRVFEVPYGPRPLLWLIGAAAGCIVVTFIGWLSLRGTLRTPPRQVLISG